MSGIRKRRKTICFALLFALCFALDRYTLHLAAQTMAGEGVTLPVIMYHSLLKDRSQAGDYVLSPDVLARDLDWLLSHGYETVTVSDLVAYTEGRGDLPAKPVMLTFDDGHFNNYVYALPLLRERGMRAVLSVIGSETARYTESGQENAYWSYLSADRLRELHESGVFEIQNHSFEMHELAPRRGCLRQTGEDTVEYRARLTADFVRTQQLLTEAGLPAPICYTYPFGAYSAESEEILRDGGFLCTLGCTEGLNRITRDPDSLYLLKRYNRPSGISSGRFFEEILK